MIKSLAVGIANICYVINPEVVILGGGIMAQEKFLKPKIDKALKEVLIERVYKNTNIEFAKRQMMQECLEHYIIFKQNIKNRRVFNEYFRTIGITNF